MKESCLPGTPVLLKEHLSLSDYYRTDSHWRQDCLLPAADAILNAMGSEPVRNGDGFETNAYTPFYGVYAGQSALNPEPDRIDYLSGGPIAGLTAFDPVLQKEIPVYDPGGCDPRDPHTLFLGGSKGVVVLANPAAPEGKELVVFRDSFGSSVSPLLCAAYRKVTLLDIRYIHPAFVKRYADFKRQDVLFCTTRRF